MSSAKKKRDGKKWRSHAFLKTREWKAVREMALSKYGSVCMRCGSKKYINVDHILPRFLNPELALTITNLQILCKGCNFDKGIRSTDYRPKGIIPESGKAKCIDTILRKTGDRP